MRDDETIPESIRTHEKFYTSKRSAQRDVIKQRFFDYEETGYFVIEVPRLLRRTLK